MDRVAIGGRVQLTRDISVTSYRRPHGRWQILNEIFVFGWDVHANNPVFQVLRVGKKSGTYCLVCEGTGITFDNVPESALIVVHGGPEVSEAPARRTSAPVPEPQIIVSGLTVVNMPLVAREEALAAAYRCTLSPHEWKWTNREQGQMAHYVLWATQRLHLIEKLALGTQLSSPMEGKK